MENDFLSITAQQLAWCKGKDEPDGSERKEAQSLVNKWNKQRIALGLLPW